MPVERRERAEHRVHTRPGAARRVQRRHGEHEAERDHGHALQDAERARFETDDVLLVKRVAHEADDSRDAGGISEAPSLACCDHGLLSKRRTPCSTSASMFLTPMCRTSLPCTMKITYSQMFFA